MSVPKGNELAAILVKINGRVGSNGISFFKGWPAIKFCSGILFEGRFKANGVIFQLSALIIVLGRTEKI